MARLKADYSIKPFVWGRSANHGPLRATDAVLPAAVVTTGPITKGALTIQGDSLAAPQTNRLRPSNTLLMWHVPPGDISMIVFRGGFGGPDDPLKNHPELYHALVPGAVFHIVGQYSINGFAPFSALDLRLKVARVEPVSSGGTVFAHENIVYFEANQDFDNLVNSAGSNRVSVYTDANAGTPPTLTVELIDAKAQHKYETYQHLVEMYKPVQIGDMWLDTSIAGTAPNIYVATSLTDWPAAPTRALGIGEVFIDLASHAVHVGE